MIERCAGGEAALQLLTGKTLRGSYVLEELVGEGNFGAVFRSEQQFLGLRVRRVAVKLSKQTGLTVETARDIFADAFLLAQALDEMTAVTARSHLVQVYDLGIAAEFENRGFLVMEYVQGSSLAAQFASYRRVPAPLLLKWVRQICLALEGLHSLVPPVLHRDLKPDNVLLGVDRQVRLIDFGLAAKLLHLGFVPGTVGTLGYMAPETSRGESVPASDVYSVGVILYQGLTGQLPFAHLVPPLDLPQALLSDWLYHQKSSLQVLPPSLLNNTVQPWLDQVVLRCLAFNPSQRFLHAGELLEALQPPPAPPDGEDALCEGRQLLALGDLPGARQAFERGLFAGTVSDETRFKLVWELGQALAAAAEHRDAAARLSEAWGCAAGRGFIRTAGERISLLEQLIAAYRNSGNSYQASRHQDELDRLRRRSG